MKQLITLTFLVQISLANGQAEQKISQILGVSHSTTSKISCQNSLTTTLLPCDFSGSTFSIQSVQSRLKDMSVVKIYYVNTTYRSSKSFDQNALDVKRLKWFNAQFPEILADPIIEWEVVEQTGCATPIEGDSYFHGFILVHRPALTEENRQDEIDALLSFIENQDQGFNEPELDPIASTINRSNKENSGATNKNNAQKNSFSKFQEGEYALFKHFQQTLMNSPGINRDRLDVWVKVSFSVSETGEISNLTFLENYPVSASDRVQNAIRSMPKWNPAYENGQAVQSTIRLDIRVSYSGDVNGMYLRNGVRPEFNEFELGLSKYKTEEEYHEAQKTMKESGIYISLDHLDSTKRFALVMDVTGSMGGSIAAMLSWIKKNNDAIPFSSFSFFNDGNNANSKPIGKTGGIYSTRYLKEVNQVVETAMRNGSGGPELSENDMESVLKAIEIDPTATDILLIGDNYSEVRDIRLLDNITKPVHVLLCAAPTKIRTEYLDIAKQTGGMLYLNGEIIDLSKIIDGESIVIQGYSYTYNGRKFRLEEKK
ncbi:MAG: hypothetical protein ACK49D_10215 [Flavobacteriia bacterium]|jgi:hypothetical protein|nr:energy transducer TonB [Cryomorphaceae bacterium]